MQYIETLQIIQAAKSQESAHGSVLYFLNSAFGRYVFRKELHFQLWLLTQGNKAKYLGLHLKSIVSLHAIFVNL